MTAPVPVSRRPLTAAVLAMFATTGKAVGDGVIPDSGWVGKPMGPDAEFDPFVVVSEITADRSFGGLGDSQANWHMPYLVESFGVLRDQCAAMAELARSVLPSLKGATYLANGARYTVAYVRLDSMSAPVRVDVTDPPFWHSQDGFTCYLMKGQP